MMLLIARTLIWLDLLTLGALACGAYLTALAWIALGDLVMEMLLG